MKQIFNYHKTRIVLSLLENKQSYGQKISRELGATYSNIVKNLADLESQKIIVSEKIGRVRNLKLTNKGLIIAERLKLLKEGIYGKKQQ